MVEHQRPPQLHRPGHRHHRRWQGWQYPRRWSFSYPYEFNFPFVLILFPVLRVLLLVVLLLQVMTMYTQLSSSTSTPPEAAELQVSYHANSKIHGSMKTETTVANSSKQSQQPLEEKPLVAYAVSITQCPSSSSSSFSENNDNNDHDHGDNNSTRLIEILDNAAVLSHSIRLLNTSYTNYHLVALLHPSAVHCAQQPLQRLGYRTLIRDTPFRIFQNSSSSSSHQNDNSTSDNDLVPFPLNGLMTKHGCCGEREFLKLYAFQLTQYQAVVHVDTDVIFINPIDELLERMVEPHQKTWQHISTIRGTPIPSSSSPIDFFFTRDYVQMSTYLSSTNGDPTKLAVQGGFFVAKPNLRMFDDMIAVIKQPDIYSRHSGWGHQHYGGYYGAAQIQGFLSFYFGSVVKGQAWKKKSGKDRTMREKDQQLQNSQDWRSSIVSVELDPCVYNTLQVWNPTTTLETHNGRRRRKETRNQSTICRDGNPDLSACTDCNTVRLSETKLTHFTTCYKPWQCALMKRFAPLCQEAHTRWFALRESWERSEGILEVGREEGFEYERFRGYCKGPKRENYVPVSIEALMSSSKNKKQEGNAILI